MVEMKNYNVMVSEKYFFYQPIENVLRTNDNIAKIATGQGDDYTTSCLQDYVCFKNYYDSTRFMQTAST